MYMHVLILYIYIYLMLIYTLIIYTYAICVCTIHSNEMHLGCLREEILGQLLPRARERDCGPVCLREPAGNG